MTVVTIVTGTGHALLAVAARLRHDAATGRALVTDDLVRRHAASQGCTAERLQREIDTAVLDVGDGGGIAT